MSKALNQISKSPFTRRIEVGRLPRRFTQPTFTTYNGKMDPVEHVSHFNQRTVVHSKNETLMCKVFPSSLGPVALRWFDGLKEDGNFDDVVVRTFKVSLPVKHDLRKSLTRKPVRSVRQLMDRIDEYKQVEEDQQQGKGKAKVVPQDRWDFRSDKYNNNRPRRDFSRQSGSTAAQMVNTMFQEPGSQARSEAQRDASTRPPLGTISVILAAPEMTGFQPSRMMSIAWPSIEDSPHDSKRGRLEAQSALSFSDEDKVGTLQPHDDALVVTLRIGEYDVKRVLVGVQLPPQEKEELMVFLKKNIDVFAWSAYEALGVDPNFICHHLNINPSVIPKKQPPRGSFKEHSNAIKEEVTILKRAGAIKEVFYPEWLANIMVVKKKSGK
ncbi:uncharacterized protein LOC142628855 [Castanea sativa]|uniref:uncharacterized protein LOC142628855 n=1 Tax=Castanea sativa TaxID=21020 RepID=UPI003F654340